MIKKIFSLSIGLFLFVACSDSKVEVLEDENGANFILSYDPKDARVSIFKKEEGNKLVDLVFVFKGKPIEKNLLGNPIYMKLEPKTEYTYKVERQGYLSEEGDLKPSLGKNSIQKVLLFTEEELNSKYEENWSEFLGSMRWDEADKKCKDAGMRLPSIRELLLAYNARILNTWEKDQFSYWSSTPYSKYKYYESSRYTIYINGDTSYSEDYRNQSGVRCRR
jgi:hypothetical protein